MMIVEWLGLYIVLGSLVGFLAGLLGVGGGGLLVPLLVSIFSYQGIAADNVVHLALGTSMACMIISSAASVRAHAARGAVLWKMVGAMAPGIICGALLSARIAAHIDSVYIATFFTVFMAVVAVQMFLNWRPKPSVSAGSPREAFLVGGGIGSISALAAVGGGFLSVAYLGYKNVEMKRAIGTSAAIGLPIAIAATIGYLISGWSKTLGDHHTLGFIHVPAFISIALASVLAAPYGVRFSHRLPETRLKKLFGLISLLLSVKMLYSTLHF